MELEEKLLLRSELPHLFSQPFYRWQREFFECANRDGMFVVAANQVGKALPDSTSIPTPNGFVNLSELKVGDLVFGWDGKPTKVLAIPFVGDSECVEFEFDDGTKVVSSEDHLWFVKDAENRFRKVSSRYGKWEVHSTRHIVDYGVYSPETNQERRYAFPLVEPVEYEKQDLPIDPYLLGLLLGDGCFRSDNLTFTNPEPEIIQFVLRCGVVDVKSTHSCPTFRFPGAFKKALEGLGLYGHRSETKFIPEVYLRSSVEDRKALLRGLMDTDGTANVGGVFEYDTASSRLANDLMVLVASLGGKTRYTTRPTAYTKNGVRIPCLVSHRVKILTPFNPFSLPRKAKRWHVIRYKNERVLRKATPVGRVACRCITVEGNGSFLVTDRYVVTHNSYAQISKAIHWATEKSLWPKLWKKLPAQFAYFYPSASLATIEFKEKWVKECLPRGSMKDHPVYGWKAVFDTRKKIEAIEFNSGVTLYFKSYEQSQMNLQAHTIAAIFTDEELPAHLYDEIRARMFATNGYFHMVFTATLGQSLWKDTMESKGVMERFPTASKWHVSMYDCLEYFDAPHIPTPWTVEKIEKIKASCKSENEILRRVYGRFVIDEGLKYHGFLRSRNFTVAHLLPLSWLIYTGLDYGSGGTGGHPSAIVFVKVSPDFRSARVYKTWRGDGIDTTAGDLLLKYRELRGSERPVLQSYDHSCKDLSNIASRIGECLVPAEKSHRIGEDLLNTLLRHGMLIIYDETDNSKLVGELESLLNDTAKTSAHDDLTDALRYAISRIPFDFSHLGEEDAKRVEAEVVKPDAPALRYSRHHDGKRRAEDFHGDGDNESEFEEANEDYESMGYL